MANMMSNVDRCLMYHIMYSEIADVELIEGIKRWYIQVGSCMTLTNVSRME